MRWARCDYDIPIAMSPLAVPMSGEAADFEFMKGYVAE